MTAEPLPDDLDESPCRCVVCREPILCEEGDEEAWGYCARHAYLRPARDEE